MNRAKGVWKLLGRWIWVPLTKYYLSKERNVALGSIFLKVPAGVFHPTLFFSTKFLLDYANTQSVSFKKILELGAGSGLLSIAMAKKSAIVTASDINPVACMTTSENAKKNKVLIEVIESDLFDNFNKRAFDLILINPPYYPVNPKTEFEKAWFCGNNYDYFQKLFIQLANFIAKDGLAVMVLSDDCNISLISELATNNGYIWQEIRRKKFMFEWNYIYKITK